MAVMEVQVLEVQEEAAMAQYNASMEARGQPSVVTTVSTHGTNTTVLDEAHAGEFHHRVGLVLDEEVRI